MDFDPSRPPAFGEADLPFPPLASAPDLPLPPAFGNPPSPFDPGAFDLPPVDGADFAAAPAFPPPPPPPAAANVPFASGGFDEFDLPPPPPPAPSGFPQGNLPPLDDELFPSDATRPMARPPDLARFAPPPAPPAGFDFGAVDLDAPPPPPPPSSGDDVFDFDEIAFDAPPPPPQQQQPAAGRALLDEAGLEFDPTAEPPASPPDDALRAFLGAHTPGPTQAHPPAVFHVRRSTGKIFGPFSPDTIRQMLADGQLDGAEQLSLDCVAWAPLAEMDEFAGAAQPAFPRGAPMGPPVLGIEGAPAGSPSEVLRMKPPSPAERAAAVLHRVRARIDRKVIAAAASLAFVGTGTALEFASPYGFWFRKPLLGYAEPAEGSPLARQLAAARQEIRRDNFAAYQRAIAAAERGLAESKEDVHARALFAQAAFSLQRKFRTGAPLPQAQSHLDALVATAGSDPEVRKARAAAALHGGQAAQVGDLLAPVLAADAADVEALVLQATAQLALGQHEAALAALERAAAAAPGTPVVLHLQGLAHLAAGDRKAAAERLAAAVAADAQHAESAVELARLALEAGDDAAARDHADAALAEGARPGIGGKVLAEAHALRATALARLREPAEAEAAFEKALAVEGIDVASRRRYGTFLLERRQYDRAAEVLERARSQAQNDLDVAEALARAWVGGGKMLQADNLVQGLRKQQPDEPRLHFLQGIVEEASGKREAAVESYRAAIEKDPARTDARVALIGALLAAGQVQEARAAAAEAVQQAPKDPAALTARGEVRLAANDVAAAVADFDAASAADPSFVRAHVGRALAAEKRNDLEAATAAWQSALAIHDAVADYHLRLGTVLWRRKEMDAAITALEAAQQLDPKNARILSRLGAAQFDAGRVDGAIGSIEGALALDNTNPETYLYLARFRRAKGDSSAAIHALRRAIALDGESAVYPFELGLVFEAANNPVEALEAFRTAVRLDPNHADALEHQGNVLVALNAIPQAVKAFEAALARDPGRTRLLLAVADCHLKSNRWDAAIAALNKARGDTSLRGVAYRMGVAWQEKGRSREAIDWFQRAAQEDASDAMPWRQLGYAYKERNRIPDAVSAFRRYLEKKPQADDRAEIEDEIATLRL